MEEKERLGSELERSKSSYVDQLAYIRMNYANELGNDRFAKALEDLQMKFMREKSDMEAQWKERVSRLSILNNEPFMYMCLSLSFLQK